MLADTTKYGYRSWPRRVEYGHKLVSHMQRWMKHCAAPYTPPPFTRGAYFARWIRQWTRVSRNERADDQEIRSWDGGYHTWTDEAARIDRNKDTDNLSR
jgi:hypothetical protein